MGVLKLLYGELLVFTLLVQKICPSLDELESLTYQLLEGEICWEGEGMIFILSHFLSYLMYVSIFRRVLTANSEVTHKPKMLISLS